MEIERVANTARTLSQTQLCKPFKTVQLEALRSSLLNSLGWAWLQVCLYTCGDLIASVPFFEDAEEGFTTSLVTLLRPAVRPSHIQAPWQCFNRYTLLDNTIKKILVASGMYRSGLCYCVAPHCLRYAGQYIIILSFILYL